ncbi:MAG: ATP--guanido phosphotransferase [Clostridia bacterium]|nr:ATP--guanido phosphotransferase [Clostridia bacterium]
MKSTNKDVAVSSRVRFARNIADYPFYGKCDPTSANEIISKVRDALGEGYSEMDLSEKDELTVGSMVEDHSISREFANSELPHALFTSENGEVKIMACEEDHIRLQVITDGLSLEKAYEEACEVDDLLASKLNIAFDDNLGYLTHCPTNLGTGMRASVMLFLPALTETGKIRSVSTQLSKLGMTIRGLYGEGSEALGCLYQVSNTETLGVTEESVISNLKDVIEKLIELENEARKRICDSDPDRFADRAFRSLGVLKYSRMIDSSEFMRCYADIRVGVSLGLINDVDLDALDRAFIEAMPYTLMKHMGKKADSVERDLARAKRIKELI